MRNVPITGLTCTYEPMLFDIKYSVEQAIPVSYSVGLKVAKQPESNLCQDGYSSSDGPFVVVSFDPSFNPNSETVEFLLIATIGHKKLYRNIVISFNNCIDMR